MILTIIYAKYNVMQVRVRATTNYKYTQNKHAHAHPNTVHPPEVS